MSGAFQIFPTYRETCCCGICSLRTGALAIGITSIVCGVLSLYPQPVPALGHLIVGCLLVFAIKAEKPGYAFAVSIIFLIQFFAFVALVILIPLFGYIFFSNICEWAHGRCEEGKESAKLQGQQLDCSPEIISDQVKNLILSFSLYVAVVAVFSWWFGSVTYSYYKLTREEQQRPTNQVELRI